MILVHDLFVYKPFFMVSYAMFFLIVGVFINYYSNKLIENNKISKILHWALKQIQLAKKDIQYVDDWDPETHSLKQYRVLSSPEDAESGEEYFRETEFGLARYVRPPNMVRIKRNVEELDPLEMSMIDLSDEEGEEEVRETDPMDIDQSGPHGDVFHNPQKFHLQLQALCLQVELREITQRQCQWNVSAFQDQQFPAVQALCLESRELTSIGTT